MLLAQLTDIHIKPPGRLAYRHVDTSACLRRTIAHVAGLQAQPDLVLITGDLVDAGLDEEYAELRRLLGAMPFKTYLMPGNHDSRGPLRRAFSDHAYLGSGSGPLLYTIEDQAVRIIALDSLLPGEASGLLGPEQLAWLDATLSAQPDRPAIIALHHPPFRTGLVHMDDIGLRDADALAEVIGRHRQVERVIAGHVHRPIQCRFAGTIASTCPSTAHQLELDLSPGAPGGFRLEPSGLQLHHWIVGAGLVTHTVQIGDWPGPFPFFDENGLLID